MNYKLSEEMISRQYAQLNTNKSEATHRRMFKSVPKSITWVRNYKSRAHSAIHSASLGTGQSVEALNDIMGAPISSETKYRLRSLDRRDSYFAQRSKSMGAKIRRKQSKARQLHMKDAYRAGYKTGMMHPSVRKDHDYTRRD